MLLRIKYLFLKIDLVLARINRHLPRIFRVSKYGIITSIIAFFVAINVVSAKQCSNLQMWLGDQNCDAATGSEGMIPGMISSVHSIVVGKVEPVTADNGNAYAETYDVSGSLLVAANNLIVDVYENTDTVSGTKYLADTMEKAGVIQPVQAQATGFSTFSPIISLWKVFRNLALGFVVAIGLLLSFMILLRVQQGQGAVTIMNALPKVLITIVLIVFSYPLAGLLVDVGNVAQKLVVSLFWNDTFIANQIPEKCNTSIYPYNIYYKQDANDPCNFSEGKGTEEYKQDFNIFRLMANFTEYQSWGTIKDSNGNDRAAKLTDIIRTPTGIGIIDSGISIVESLPADQIMDLVITIVIIIAVIKIFFALVRAFAEIILYTIFAPVVFLFYPLSGSVIMTWFRYFLTSSLLFPATFFMLLLAAIIAGHPHPPWFTTTTISDNLGGIAPDLLRYSVNVDFNGNSFLPRMISLVVVMMIPTLPQFLMQVLKAPESMLLQGAKQSFKSVASRIPIVGGMFNM